MSQSTEQNKLDKPETGGQGTIGSSGESLQKPGVQDLPAGRGPSLLLEERNRAAAANPESDKPDLPALDEITADTDVSMFMAGHVDEELRREALRKLFRTARFNRCDGLDDYCEDYNSFESLGDVVTADMRHRVERLARAAAPDAASSGGASPSAPDGAEARKQGKPGSESPIGAPSATAGVQPWPSFPTLEVRDESPLAFHPAVCGIGANGRSGCTRCINACPEGAIVAAGNSISVDPARCRGSALCASACPTADLSLDALSILDEVRSHLNPLDFHTALHPCLIFHCERLPPDELEAFLEPRRGYATAMKVSSLPAIGAEVSLAALAFGASQVIVLVGGDTTDAVALALEDQASFASSILESLGLGRSRVRVIRSSRNDRDAGETRYAEHRSEMLIPHARFSPLASKRLLLFQALDWLWDHSPEKPAFIPLPDGSPFGAIAIEKSACTFCMACVGACPSGALSDGEHLPELGFLEECCFQCGLCRNVCPENAIKYIPRLLLDPGLRKDRRLLCDAERFRCVVCGEPFATAPMIAKMIQKLEGHSLYQDESAKRRLRMCGDCRVRDMYRAHKLSPE
jgi:ferredoxin